MELTLQELLDAVTALGDGTDEQRAAAVAALLAERGADPVEISDAALKEYSDLRGDPDSAPSNETLPALKALGSVVDGARQHQTQLQGEADARAEEVKALDARVQPPADGAPETPPADPEVGPDAPPADEDIPPVPEPAAEAVAASGRRGTARVNLAALKRPEKSRPLTESARPSAVITASGDVPGYTAGQPLDMDGLTAAVISRMSAFPREHVPGAFMRAGIASIKIPFTDPGLVIGDKGRDQDVLDYAGSQARLKGGSLTASGGWCSPSETLYDLCPGIESATVGLIDVPDIQVSRGGIRTTEGPDIAAVFSSIGFAQTETQAIANTVKPSYRVPCPSFTETRAGVTGVNIISGILQDDAYPEMTRRVVELAVAVHAHKVNQDTIAGMVAASTDLGTINAGISVTTSLLNVIEMQVTDYRYRYRADENLLLEMPLPYFVRPMIRADISLRTGVPFERVTDQQIAGYFLASGVNVQWVYDWQDAFSGVSGGFGTDNTVKVWPTSVKVMIYAAGAFVRGRGGVINMEGVYDAANLALNDFTRLFMEEKFLIRRRCYQSRTFTVPLAVNGASGCCVNVDVAGNLIPDA